MKTKTSELIDGSPRCRVRAWKYHRALRPGESKRNRFEIQYKTSLTPNLIIFVFNAGHEKWAWPRILDLGSTSTAGRVLEKLFREVIGKSMVPVLCMFSFRRLLRTSEGGGGKGRANRRNGSDQRVAGSADGNSDLLRVTRCKLSCGTFGTLPLEQLEALKTDTMGLMVTILAEPQSDPAQLTKARTL